MKTPRIHLPKKDSLAIILIALAVVALITAAIVHFENKQKADARTTEKTHLAQVEHDRKADQAIKDNADLQNQVIQSAQKTADVCNYIVHLPKAKAVALPPQCK